MKKILLILSLLLFLTACSPTPAATPVAATLPPAVTILPANLVKLHTSPSVQAWEADANTCADKLGLILMEVIDPQQADLVLRLGEPDGLTTPSYKIGQEDLLVVTNRESPVQNSDLAGVQNLFAHPETQQVQVWVYAPGDDAQQVFAKEIMRGQTVSSFGMLAAGPQQMSDTLNQNKNALGFLPRHWKAGSVRDVFSLPNIPVLAIVKAEPQGSIKALLACLQKP